MSFGLIQFYKKTQTSNFYLCHFVAIKTIKKGLIK